MSNDAPSAGWYPNPDGTGGLRWWSGVGWTEYTRPGAETDAGTDQTQVLSTQAPTQVQPAASEPTTAWDQSAGASPWGQPAAPQPEATWVAPGAPQVPAPGYGAYTPPPVSPLTASGMRPLSGMFADIGRITRRAWWPILAISALIWVAVTAVLGVATAVFVDFGALRRGFDALGTAMEENPAGDFTESQLDQMAAAFSDAFGRLPLAGWLLLGLFAWVLLLLATTVQIGAVSRLAMDAASGAPLSWRAAWGSGFTAGFRLFGYYLLLLVLVLVAVVLVTLVIVLTAQLAPWLAVAVGILAFLGGIAVSFWLTGRLIPALAQAVVGRRALSWSWRATRGKFWAVLGRYLLWSLAASVVINIVSSIVSIPVSLLFLGGASATDPSASLGLALTLNLLLLPFTMALGAITFMGIVPIWRDLTDHPAYRSIDDTGVPVPPPAP